MGTQGLEVACGIPTDAAAQIQAEAERLGFCACGIVPLEPIPEDVQQTYRHWIESGYHGEMAYLERNESLRFDPRVFVPEAKSIIVVAMNYYPEEWQNKDAPQISCYAYGRDYHKVVKKGLEQLLRFVQTHIDKDARGRAFSDSAPLLERYWAERAGLGFRGKHGLLIIPKAGSFVFLGELIITTELPTKEQKIERRCGTCTRCLEACPTQALIAPGVIDARRCISYLTIEYQGQIPRHLADLCGDRIYGCDICQSVCPWNVRYAQASKVADFAMRPSISSLSWETLEQMQEQTFDSLFAGSPIRRTGLAKLQQTLRDISSQECDESANEQNKDTKY